MTHYAWSQGGFPPNNSFPFEGGYVAHWPAQATWWGCGGNSLRHAQQGVRRRWVLCGWEEALFPRLAGGFLYLHTQPVTRLEFQTSWRRVLAWVTDVLSEGFPPEMRSGCCGSKWFLSDQTALTSHLPRCTPSFPGHILHQVWAPLPCSCSDPLTDHLRLSLTSMYQQGFLISL